MTRPALYPLRFRPIFKSMLWGGRRLPEFLNHPHPADEPVGEAWVLSDVDGHPSRVVDGPLAGTTLRDLLAADPVRLLGPARLVNGRFPLLLKFIDARQELSVQVHPNDEQAARKHHRGNGKTEAWVVLDAHPTTSRIYAGFRHGVTAGDFRAALAAKTTPDTLHSFSPRPGDCVFLEAGTVHAIGAEILLFEVQQTCDVTYRLYDWDRTDARTGAPRELHIEDGLACADFARGPCHAARPVAEDYDGVRRERLVSCPYFTLERHTAPVPFRVGVEGRCRVVVCVEGRGDLESLGRHVPITAGDVFLLPAEVGECACRPAGGITLLECGLPE
jgi:mannose-6-phosphate isomerase